MRFMKKGIGKKGNSRLIFDVKLLRLPKSKRSQVTPFIIVAILLIGILGGYFLVKNIEVDLIDKVDSEVRPIYSFVENCLEDTSVDGIYYVGETGGYFVPAKESTVEGIAYYYLDGNNYFPDKKILENELALYIENFVGFCSGEFVDFPDFDIEVGEINVETVIMDNEVIVETDYFISIKKGENSYSFNKFESVIPIRLGIVYNVSREMTNDLIENNGDVCISCVARYGEENDLYINVLDYEEKSFVFFIRDPNSVIDDKEFRYYFASG